MRVTDVLRAGNGVAPVLEAVGVIGALGVPGWVIGVSGVAIAVSHRLRVHPDILNHPTIIFQLLVKPELDPPLRSCTAHHMFLTSSPCSNVTMLSDLHSPRVEAPRCGDTLVQDLFQVPAPELPNVLAQKYELPPISLVG